MTIHFAPLQGFTTALYRQLHHTIWGGVTYYYTPFVRLEKGEFRKKDLDDIAPENNQSVSVVPQMLPRDAEELRRMSQLFIDNGYTRADINMGCPFPPVALHGRGSGLLTRPDTVAQLLLTIEEFPQLQFSIKMRPGWQDKDEWRSVINILNKAPLSHITLHPRIGRQQYKGKADQEIFTHFCNECRHPIIYNGDLMSTNDIQQINSAFPRLAGIMLGRGLLARPYLSTLINKDNSLSAGEIIDKTQQFHDHIYRALLTTSQGDTQLLQRAKAQWEYFLPHAPRKERKAVLKAATPAKYEQATAQLFDRWRKDISIDELL